MQKIKITKGLMFFFVIILSLQFLFPGSIYATTRGKMISVILEIMNIPLRHRGSHFSDVPEDHPYSQAIGTARAMGIIYPGERFHPDMEATVAEAIFFALRTMGLEHEAGLIKEYSMENRMDIPLYISPYLELSQKMEPSLPEPLKDQMTDDLTERTLFSIIKWIEKCKSSLQWKFELGEKPCKLIIYREGIGRPSGKWAVKVAEFNSREKAHKELQKFLAEGHKGYIQQDTCSYSVYSGPYDHYEAAWKDYQDLNRIYDSSLVPAVNSQSKALFWAAIRIDPALILPEIITAPSISGYKLPLSWMAEYTNADAAINGGYFFRNRPVGSLVIDRIPVSAPLSYRSAFGWNNAGDLSFGNGNLRCRIKKDKEFVNITAFNTPPSLNGLAIYTPDFVNYATDIPKDSVEFAVKNDTLISKKRWLESNHFVPREGFLLVARGGSTEIAGSFNIGDRIELVLDWADNRMTGSTNVIQGGPMLIESGERTYDNEKFRENFTERPHPRTIAASDGCYLWFFVFDGRDPRHSGGVTLKEATRILLDMGMIFAVNLDGGGSTQMIWKGNIINRPSGGTERLFPYSIIVRQSGS